MNDRPGSVCTNCRAGAHVLCFSRFCTCCGGKPKGDANGERAVQQLQERVSPVVCQHLLRVLRGEPAAAESGTAETAEEEQVRAGKKGKPGKPRRIKHVHDYRAVEKFPVPGKKDHILYRCSDKGCNDEYHIEGSV